MSEVADNNKPITPGSTLDGLIQSFPFSSIRPAQEQSLGVVATTRDAGKPFSILEVPTGGGKSGIGMATATYAAELPDGTGAHYLTSQNSLSTQLVQDFGSHGLVELRGKRNYKCINHVPQDCSIGSTMNLGGRTCESCPYRVAKNTYVNGKLGVTNYSYYLTETMHSGELTPRDTLVLDEAHNIEREILALVDINITQHKSNDVDAGRIPTFALNEDNKVRHWLKNQFVPSATRYVNFLQNEIENMQENGKKPLREVVVRVEGFKQMLGNIELYMETDSPEDWLAWSDDRGTLCIKPLTASEFAQRYLFEGTPNIVLMSATILDFGTFRRNLGIKHSTATTFAVPSDFPVANRKIVYWPVGSMGSKNIAETLPRMVDRTSAILRAPKYADKKGIIHTHSYKINSYLQEGLGSTEHKYRILTHSNVQGSREKAIADHIASEDPSVLMSPSMTEGLDLKGDLSRIQIITKVPYPFLDPYNRTRMDRDPKWYQLQTALTLVQATGRSVRSADDYATTVILDADFGRFLSMNQDILPKWWLDSIEFR